MKYLRHIAFDDYKNESHVNAPAVVYDNSELLYDDIILTEQSNEELFTLMQTAGVYVSDHPTYYTKADLGKITQQQFENILFSNSNIKTFNEFQYFINVTTIPNNCFTNSSLCEITLHNLLEFIDDNAFSNTNLKKIVLTNSIDRLGESVFEGCQQLEEIKLSTSLTSIPAYVFSGCNQLKLIQIQSIESIDDYAFNNTSLNAFNVSSGNINTINQNIFTSTNVEAVIIPQGVTEIGAYAFAYCTSLKKIVIPESVTHIRAGAFAYCTSLQHIICLKTTAPLLVEANSVTPFTGINTYGRLEYPTSSDYSIWLSYTKGYLGYFGWNDTIIATDVTNKPFIDWVHEQQWVPQELQYMSSHQAALITQTQFNYACSYVKQNNNIIGFTSLYIDKIKKINELRYFTNLNLLATYNSEDQTYGNRFYFGNAAEITLPATSITNIRYFFGTRRNNKLKRITVPADFTTFYTNLFYIFDFYNLDTLQEIVFESQTQPELSGVFKQCRTKNIIFRYPKGADYSQIISELKSAGGVFATWKFVEGIYENPDDLIVWHGIAQKIDISNVSIIQTNSLTYTGTTQSALFTVKNNNVTLALNTDYIIVANSNQGTNAGTYTFTIQGKGDYTGTATKEWIIAQRNITPLTLITPSSQISITYDGQSHAIASSLPATIQVKDTSANKTYDLTTSDRTLSGQTIAQDPGTYTVTINGVGNYTGSQNLTWIITSVVDIGTSQNITVTLTPSSYTYNGNACTPAVTVKNNSTTLTQNTHYTVSYENNVNVGTASVIITAITGSGYVGTKTVPFTISEPSSSLQITSVNVSYDGSSHSVYATPGVAGTIYYGSSSSSLPYSIHADSQVMLSDVSLTNNGSITVYAYLVPDDSNYPRYPQTGTVQGTITISRKSISSASAYQSNSLTYNGSQQTATFDVYVDGVLLSISDYTVSNNTATNASSNYSATITGAGNYTGQLTVSWSIEKQSTSIYVYSNGGPADGQTYYIPVQNYSSIGGTIYYNIATTSSNPGSYPYTQSIGAYGNANDYIYLTQTGQSTQGTWYVFAYLVPSDTTNYENSPVDWNILSITSPSVIQISNCTITISPTEYTYDGNAKTPTVTVKYNGTNVSTSNYTVTYSNNTNAGTATVTITGKNQYGGSTSIPFTINKANPVVTVTGYNNLYDGQSHSATVTTSVAGRLYYGSTNGSTSYYVTCPATNAQLSSINRTNAGQQTVYTIFEPTNTNYNSLSIAVDIIIQPIPISACTITISPTSYVYDGSAKTPTVTVTYQSMNSSFITYTKTYSNNVHVGTGTVRITGTGNFTGDVYKTFTITKKKATLTLTGYSVTYNPANNDTYYVVGTKSDTGRIFYGTTYGSGQYATSTSTQQTMQESLTSIYVPPAGTKTVYAYLVPNNSADIDNSDVVSATLSMNKLSLSMTLVTVSPQVVTYNGQQQTPAVTVTYNGVTVPSSEYTVLYANNMWAGTATVTVTAVSSSQNYSGSKSTTFTIIENYAALYVSDLPTAPPAQETFYLSLNNSMRVYVVARYEGTQNNTPRYVNVSASATLTRNTVAQSLVSLADNGSYYTMTGISVGSTSGTNYALYGEYTENNVTHSDSCYVDVSSGSVYQRIYTVPSTLTFTLRVRIVGNQTIKYFDPSFANIRIYEEYLEDNELSATDITSRTKTTINNSTSGQVIPNGTRYFNYELIGNTWSITPYYENGTTPDDIFYQYTLNFYDNSNPSHTTSTDITLTSAITPSMPTGYTSLTIYDAVRGEISRAELDGITTRELVFYGRITFTGNSTQYGYVDGYDAGGWEIRFYANTWYSTNITITGFTDVGTGDYFLNFSSRNKPSIVNISHIGGSYGWITGTKGY